MSELKNIGVIGAGMMGAEIALCFALAGCRVELIDQHLEAAQKGKDRLGAVLDKAIAKGRLEAGAKDAALERIAPAGELAPLARAELVIEAVFEDLAVKREIWRGADQVCPPTCLLASNTSSLPITLLAAGLGPERRSRFLGAHFFSPASVMKLVEVIPGLETGEEAVAQMSEACRFIGKTPIRVKDVPGFAVNRLLHAMWIEANRLVEEGVASVEDVDIACKLGLGHPVGPYTLMDLTSNDLNLWVQEILFEAYGERFRPRPVLKQKVNANHLGRKTGRGWHDYSKR
ncbi:MAG: 3-hydroxyacyl-CoA dehydrogenase family protein [Desulfarculaceae bacterium]|nr:3-hydroxyacyl-CoA dehydrogenase family protein [Desulfarculaceae bacterium]